MDRQNILNVYHANSDRLSKHGVKSFHSLLLHRPPTNDRMDVETQMHENEGQLQH